MKHGLIASIVALMAALLAVSLIAAQGSYPLNDTFDTDASGWAPTMHQLPNGSYVTYASITWLASKDLQLFYPYPLLTHADGVIEVKRISANTLPDIRKIVYLQPGAYQVKFRGGSDFDNNFRIVLSGAVTNGSAYFDNPWLASQFYENTTDVFSVIAPGPITIILSANADFYLDYIRIEPYTGTTPTPYTTMVVTPIPTNQQATPMPVPTQYCQPPAATPTGPASFDVTPTATPDISGDWQFIDTFSGQGLSNDWETSVAGATVNTSMSGPDNAAGVLEAAYASAPEIIYFHAITPTIYVDGWAMANALPIGATAEVHVMLWDGPSYGWIAAGSQEFGPGQWYPFHITVTDPGLHSLPGTAVAIYVSGPASDRAYLDNIYIYNSTRGAPICGFIPGTNEDDYSTYLIYPADKPCPSDTSGIQDVPNNFWGPLFFWMSIQFLSITSPFPVHEYLGYAMAFEQFIQSPYWKYIQFATTMFDFRPIIAVSILLMVLEGLRVIYSIWRLILKIIPMMG